MATANVIREDNLPNMKLYDRSKLELPSPDEHDDMDWKWNLFHTKKDIKELYRRNQVDETDYCFVNWYFWNLFYH